MRRKIWLILAAVLALTACSTPDEWAVLEPEYGPRPAPQLQTALESTQVAGLPLDGGAALGLPLASEGRLELSIEDAVFLALSRNSELRVQALNPVIQGAFELIERGVYDPEFFVEYTQEAERVVETARATGEQFGVTADESAFAAGVRQRLPTGTTLEATVEQSRSTSSRTPEQQTARGGLSITQALLQGLGPKVNFAAIRQAELETLASVHQLRGYAEALVAEVETAYWNHVLAREEIRIFETSLAVAESQLDDIEQRVEVGRMAPTEAAAARAERARREQDLIDARSALQAKALRLAMLLHMEGEVPALQVVTTSNVTDDTLPLDDIYARLEAAQQFRPEIREAELLLRRDELETVVTRNGLLPRMDLFVTLGQSGYADTLTDSFERIDDDNYDWSAGLLFNYRLGRRSARGLDLAARATAQQARESLENLRRLVRLDVLLAANEVERARQQVGASAKTRLFAEQTAAAEQDRFEAGVSTALQLAQAQRDLLEAQIDEARALIGYRVALIELYRAEGTLLQRRGVQLPEDASSTTF